MEVNTDIDGTVVKVVIVLVLAEVIVTGAGVKMRVDVTVTFSPKVKGIVKAYMRHLSSYAEAQSHLFDWLLTDFDGRLEHIEQCTSD